MSAPLLELDDIDVAYADAQVLYGLSLEVHAGEIVTLLGSNGAGKTTALRAIAGLCRVSRGDIRFRGASLLRVAPAARPALGIALVPEGRELWAQLSVRENLELGAYARAARGRCQRNLERVWELFPRLLERSAQPAGSLSGGEQQMCAIGRALMSEPALLLLDEPSLGLAPRVAQQLLGVIAQLRSAGTTVLLVEQNLRQALAVAQRGTVIEGGRVRLRGTSQELLDNPQIRAAYLGL
ncbi:MAG: ABC transporter ATP-binding protein [Deltaproteobacteria bacterium]